MKSEYTMIIKRWHCEIYRDGKLVKEYGFGGKCRGEQIAEYKKKYGIKEALKLRPGMTEPGNTAEASNIRRGQ